jgi:nucleotide-binding universal stress UspA family protein
MWALRKILFPVDFSERSLCAARYVRALACHFHSEVELLHVVPPPAYGIASLEGGTAMLTEVWEEERRRAGQDLDGFAATALAEAGVRPLVLEGDPATTIVEEARGEGHDLIVMATHGYGQFRRFILGSVTAKVLHDADCPVLTGTHFVDGAAGEPKLPQVSVRQVVCAVDLSAHSEKVLHWAARLAEAFDARMFLVHALPALKEVEGDYYGSEWRADQAAGAREQLAKLLQGAGIHAQILVVGGEAPRAVCSQAAELGADLLVIGRSSESGLLGRLRTNAYAIIRGAECPVVSI